VPDPWSLDDFRDEVGATLDAFVDERSAELAPLGDDAVLLLDAARRALSGGKRLRAAFCWWGYRSARADVEDGAALLRAAGALEVLHASALVHDDYMDASDTRRGQAATHKAFEARHQAEGWRGPGRQYGAAAAILLGDLLLTWSDRMLRRCGLPTDVVARALDVFDTTRSEVIAGQFLDVSAQARGRGDVASAMQVLRYKSAKYSVERPLHVGAALAGAGEEHLQALTGFGLPLGEAFQLRDDLLGVFGDPGVTGKPAGDDLTEGKRTVLVALALQGARAADAARLDAALGQQLDPAEVDDLRRVIDGSGAAAEVERRIGVLTAQALEALEAAPVTDVARRALQQLADAATRRAG
jgi:geranylgeranyl diphosphate synthase type I